MREAESELLVNLFDGADLGVRGITGDIDGEPVFALMIMLLPKVAAKLVDGGTFEARCRWSAVDCGREAGLALDLEIALEGEPLISDRLIFRLGQEESMAQLQCLMRQACLPAIFLDSRVNELSKVGFAWTGEDRSEIASLIGTELSRAYWASESLSGLTIPA